MNIVLLTSVYPSPDEDNENVTKVVRYFAKEWERQGHRVLVFHNVHRYPAPVHMLPRSVKHAVASKVSFYIPDLDAVKERCFDDGGVRVWRLPTFKLLPHGGHPERVIDRHADKIAAIIDAEGLVPDIIIGHWMSPQVQLIDRLKKRYPCRTALVLHGRGYIEDPKFDARRYLGSVDALGCRSKAEAAYVRKALGLTEDPFICYSGVPDDFVEGRSFDGGKFAAAPQTWRLLYAGRLVAYKNIDKILHALAAVEEEFVFDIIGSGAEEEKLKALAKELGIADKVVFHGRMPRQAVLEHMHKAHCFVMISKDEVFGLVYLEAMAASCIAVGSEDEGIDGVIRHGENGLLVPAGDAAALADALRGLFAMSPDRAAVLSRAGFETARTFTDSNVARWYLRDAMGQGMERL